MRVAIVAMETIHRRDTAGVHRLDRLATSLARDGHDVTVYCAQWWDGHDPVFEAGPITYRAVTVEPAAPSFAARLPTALARGRPDVVHASAAPASAVVAASAGAAMARAPLVVEWFGDEGVAEGRLTSLAIRRADAIVTPSELVRTRVRERGATEAGTTVVPESIDFDAIADVEPDDDVQIAFGHRLDENANAESLLLGLAELREKGWTATVVGDGPARDAYERQAADLRIDDRVEFAGACDRERRIEIYRGAHVFVQSAYRECFATELLWALACGCVGIVEYQAESSAHELVEQRDRSYRVTSTQQMAEAITDSGEFDHRTIDDDFATFDHDAVRGEYEDLYERLVAERGLLG